MAVRSERDVGIFESAFVLLEYQKPKHRRCQGGCPYHGILHWIHGHIRHLVEGKSSQGTGRSRRIMNYAVHRQGIMSMGVGAAKPTEILPSEAFWGVHKMHLNRHEAELER